MPRKKQAKKRLSPSGFEHIRTKYGVSEYRLKQNGLTVLYKQDTTTPVVGVMVTYLVGSRHEVLGTTGATHILEHLMFKGSKKFPPKKGMEMLTVLAKKGAQENATTWVDRTNYYTVLPKEHLTDILEREADRMRHAIINKSLLKEELPAVLSEYASGRNDPLRVLHKSIWETAFTSHPYHHETIGYLNDIETVTAEQLQQFYNTYYHPNNAYVTIVGDIELKEALTSIKQYFGVHSATKEAIPLVTAVESRQRGTRTTEINRVGSQQFIGVGYKVPEASHKDTPTLFVLQDILAGGTASRLHQALVETGLATDVFSTYTPFHDPGLLPIIASLTTGTDHKQVRDIIEGAARAIAQNGITETELERVQSTLLTDMAIGRDGHTEQLNMLNEGCAVGDWQFYYALPQKVRRVTKKQVQEAAATYLTPQHMTVGIYRGTQ